MKEKLFALQFIELFFKRLGLLSCFCLSCGIVSAQSGPLRFRSPFDSAPTDTIRLLSKKYIPDLSFASMAGLHFILASGTAEKPVTVAITNSAALLAFEDSLLKKPMKVEKRRAFPFSAIKPDHEFALVYTCSTGDGDYLGFKLISIPDQELLDEVMLCIHSGAAQLEFRSCRGWMLPK